MKKSKMKKPRDWAMVHLINRGGSGVHDKRIKRSTFKQKLKKQIKKDINEI